MVLFILVLIVTFVTFLILSKHYREMNILQDELDKCNIELIITKCKLEIVEIELSLEKKLSVELEVTND